MAAVRVGTLLRSRVIFRYKNPAPYEINAEFILFRDYGAPW
jgi:hypothetical protein